MQHPPATKQQRTEMWLLHCAQNFSIYPSFVQMLVLANNAGIMTGANPSSSEVLIFSV